MTPSSADGPATPTGTRPQISVRHLFVLVPIAALGWRAAAPLADNSFLWHVRAGTVQLDRGEVLRADPFSFLAGGEPWRTQSWLIELGYGWLERATDSLQWAPAMMFAVLAATLAFVGLAVYRVVGDPLRTALVVTLVAVSGMVFVVPRPVLFSFLLLAVFGVVLQHERRLGWVLIPLAWFWASVHGLFVVGLGLIVLEAARRRSRRLFAVGAAAATATLLTAHGAGVIRILLDFFENRDALGFLSEWERPDFTEPFLLPYLLLVLAIAGALALRRLGLRHLVVVLPVAILGFSQLRSVYPAMLVLAPAAAAFLPASRPGAYSKPPGSETVNRGLAAAVVLLGLLGLARPLSYDETDLPPATVRRALTENLVFHGPGAGGMLIWAEYPERRIFVDDRAELYGADVFEEVVATIDGTAGTRMLDRNGLDEALLKTSWELGETLAEAGWIQTYRDDNWVIYRRP